MQARDARRPLFDEDWYRRDDPDFDGDAYAHFANFGWRAKRDPHPLFDVAYYLEQVPELIGGDENPLEHYLRVGAANGVDPHPLFDSAFYLGRYGVAVGEDNPLVHYLEIGGFCGFDPNLFFVSSLYLEAWEDVRELEMNPLEHFARFGGKEWARAPHPLFDSQSYARRHRLPVGVNPLTDFFARLHAVRAHAARPVERPDVSAIILNFNKSLLTLECVADLLLGAGALALEVVVVDNGSDPSDFGQLAANLPSSVKLVRLATNRFFGEGNNIGVEASSGSNLLFLNNDAFVGETTLQALYDVLLTRADAGAAGPRFVYTDGLLQECGAMVSDCGTVTQRGKGLDDQPGRLRTTEPVDYVSAACLLMPRDVFERIGGFDLAWDPAYYEDVDLCLKLKLIGKKTYYCADATVTHIENATSSDPSHGLRLNTVVAINREKFISRWGEYIAHGDDASYLRFALPAPLAESAQPAAETAVLYTPYPLVPGGGERYLLSIAQALSRRYRTYLVTPERYSTFRLRGLANELELDLSHVRLATAAALPRLAADCALFFAMGNEALPPIPALGRRRVFICQFPFPMHPNHLARTWGGLDEYDDVLVYSPFAARHFKSRAKRLARALPNVTVLPPPSPMYADAGPAGRIPGRIVNVGRFAPGGHCKRQDTLVDAFRKLVDKSGRKDLDLHLIGTVSADPAARDYFLDVRQRAAGLPVSFHLNASADVVRELYATATCYWHATGFGENETRYPERMEHFGISVVEAMSAGTIPLVYAAGGPADIVDDGENGAHWRNADELVQKTLEILEMSEDEADALRGAALGKARRFDADAFELRLAGLFDLDLDPPESPNGVSNGLVPSLVP
ncbi:MAG: glycosyltransferase [Candidatus Eremiobacteraeota bacterium]|nr:glycosyltransferase [Candidatus Eremiobacteraeota bacterium]